MQTFGEAKASLRGQGKAEVASKLAPSAFPRPLRRNKFLRRMSRKFPPAILINYLRTLSLLERRI